MRLSASVPARRLAPEGAKNTPRLGIRAGVKGADRADDLRRPPVHADRALRSGGGQYQPADDGRADESDLLGDEAANGKAQEIHLAEARGDDERNGVAGH